MTKLSFILPHKISKNSDVVYVNYKKRAAEGGMEVKNQEDGYGNSWS